MCTCWQHRPSFAACRGNSLANSPTAPPPPPKPQRPACPIPRTLSAVQSSLIRLCFAVSTAKDKAAQDMGQERQITWRHKYPEVSAHSRGLQKTVQLCCVMHPPPPCLGTPLLVLFLRDKTCPDRPVPFQPPWTLQLLLVLVQGSTLRSVQRSGHMHSARTIGFWVLDRCRGNNCSLRTLPKAVKSRD